MQSRKSSRWFDLALALVAVSCGGAAPSAPSAQSNQGGQNAPTVPPTFAVLVFSKTEGFRHDSIPAGLAAIREQGRQRGFSVDASEDSSVFTDDALAKYGAVVFLSTTGDILNQGQQDAFERFIRRGGGFVGIHSAADTEYDWAFYGGLLGAYFAGHPDIQTASVRIEFADHPSVAGLPTVWSRRDEWYNFQKNPRGTLNVLATLDERTYNGGTMGSDHPIIWSHGYQGGRALYTAGGHTSESYSEPLFANHLGNAIVWAALGRN